MLARREVLPLIRSALREDGASRDLTSSALLPAQQRARAQLVAKRAGILAGGPVAMWTFHAVDRSLRCRLQVREGARLRLGQVVLTVEGRARAILAAERTALNLLSHLSGIATLTAAYVRRAHPARIYDTRKTLPGLRVLERYAVRVGGGHNHRAGLHAAILIKTNHLKAAVSSQQSAVSTLQEALKKAKAVRPRRFVEIEVTNLREFKTALAARPDAILLDNWHLSDIRKAIALRHPSPVTHHPSPLLEVSGGVTLANVRAIARAGVDRISVGRLTHSAPALDCSLHVV